VPLPRAVPRFLGELADALVGAEVAARHQHHTLLERELLRPVPDQEYVRTPLHDQAREFDRVLHVPHAGHGSRPRSPAVHDGGIQLRIPILIQYRPAPGVELRVILHHAYGRGDRIQARAAALQDRVGRIQCRRQPRLVGGGLLGGHLGSLGDADAAVDGDRDRRRPRRRWRGCGGLGAAEECKRQDRKQVRARHFLPPAAMIGPHPLARAMQASGGLAPLSDGES